MFFTLENLRIIGLIILLLVGTFIVLLFCWKLASLCTSVAPDIAMYLPTDDSYSTIESGGILYGIIPVPYIRNKYEFKEESVEPVHCSGRFSESETLMSSMASSLPSSSEDLTKSTKSVHWKDDDDSINELIITK